MCFLEKGKKKGKGGGLQDGPGPSQAKEHGRVRKVQSVYTVEPSIKGPVLLGRLCPLLCLSSSMTLSISSLENSKSYSTIMVITTVHFFSCKVTFKSHGTMRNASP